MSNIASTSLNSYYIIFNSASINQFNIAPYEWQVSVGSQILFKSSRREKAQCLCAEGTGKDKSHLCHILSCQFKGTTARVSPLLALVSDQCEKLKKKAELNPQSNTIPIYLDALKTNNDIEGLVHALMQQCNDYTVILFTFLQTIAAKISNFILHVL